MTYETLQRANQIERRIEMLKTAILFVIAKPSMRAPYPNFLDEAKQEIARLEQKLEAL